ncbi:MAG: ABC transporter permease [bacterium]
MKFLDSLKLSLDSLKSHKVRSALTMLGIIIGISSVITVISIGNGAQNLILSQIVSMGSNTIFVEPGSWDPNQRGDMMQQAMEEFEITTLTYEDALAIAEDPSIKIAAPMVFGVSRAVYKDLDKKITFMGVTPESLKINETYATAGRTIEAEDVKSLARVAVLGYNVKKDLFGDDNPLEKTIKIKNVNFRIIGVAQEQGTQMFQNLDENIYIPLTTAQEILLGIDNVRWIVAEAISEDKIDEAVDSIRLILRERHEINNPENDPTKDDFKVMSQKETADIMTTVTGILTIFLSSVAAIALLVGGIGIMNIMLVSVTERTKEIGLRKAIGARRKDILYQFLTEAVVLTVFGGLIGAIIGICFSYLASIVLSITLGVEWDFIISLNTIALAFGVSTIVGLVFGIYPANKAAKLSPIEALRYE